MAEKKFGDLPGAGAVDDGDLIPARQSKSGGGYETRGMRADAIRDYVRDGLSASDVGARPDDWRPEWPADIDNAPALGTAAAHDAGDFAAAQHGHAIGDVSGLAAALSQKADTSALGTASTYDASDFAPAGALRPEDIVLIPFDDYPPDDPLPGKFYIPIGGSGPVVTVPGAPVLALAGKTDTTITVSWSAPVDGGSSITSYRLYVGGNLAISNASSPQQIVGLDPETEYSITVSALNAVGEGPQSAALVVTTEAGTGGDTVPTPTALKVSEQWDGPAGAIPVEFLFFDQSEGGSAKQLQVGYFANGWPFVVSDGEAYLEMTPASRQVETIPWEVEDGVFDSPDAVINGAMRNPLVLSGYVTKEEPGVPDYHQGFSELLDLSSRKLVDINYPKRTTYDPLLNIDPGVTGSRIKIGLGDEFCVVKYVDEPAGEGEYKPLPRQGNNMAVLFILKEAPPDGSMPPPICGEDKTPMANVRDLNADLLTMGAELTDGMPDLNQVKAREFIPNNGLLPQSFGLVEETQRRPYLVHDRANTDPGKYSPSYSRDVGIRAARYVAALIDHGPEGLDLRDILLPATVGLQLIAVQREWHRLYGEPTYGGFLFPGAAGQQCGLGLWGLYAGMAFPELEAEGRMIGGNEFGSQNYWVGPEHVGSRTSWPDNKDRLGITAVSTDLGMPEWRITSWRPVDLSLTSSYRTTSGPATFPLVTVGMLLKSADGRDGSEVLAQGEGFGSDNDLAAPIGYNDRYRTFIINGGGVINIGEWGQYYDNHRDKAAAPVWSGPPDRLQIGYSLTSPVQVEGGSPHTFITPIAGGFSWDMTVAVGSTSDLTDAEVEYSHDLGMTWTPAGTGLTGSKTDLPDIPTRVRVRRKNALGGWGGWSTADPYSTSDPNPAEFIPLSGGATGTVVAVESPRIVERVHPDWNGTLMQSVTGSVEAGSRLYIATGNWSGAVSGDASITIERANTENGNYEPSSVPVQYDAILNRPYIDVVGDLLESWIVAKVGRNGVVEQTPPVGVEPFAPSYKFGDDFSGLRPAPEAADANEEEMAAGDYLQERGYALHNQLTRSIADAPLRLVADPDAVDQVALDFGYLRYYNAVTLPGHQVAFRYMRWDYVDILVKSKYSESKIALQADSPDRPYGVGAPGSNQTRRAMFGDATTALTGWKVELLGNVHPEGAVVWSRYQLYYQGGDEHIRGRTWLDGDDEPSTWDIALPGSQPFTDLGDLHLYVNQNNSGYARIYGWWVGINTDAGPDA